MTDDAPGIERLTDGDAKFSDRVHHTKEEVEAAWAAEIQRRVAQARAGELESTDWRTVLDRVKREVLGS